MYYFISSKLFTFLYLFGIILFNLWEDVMETQLQEYKDTRKLSKIYSLILYFFIFAFLGWVLESLYSVYELGHFTKRGFLYGPICPI